MSWKHGPLSLQHSGDCCRHYHAPHVRFHGSDLLSNRQGRPTSPVHAFTRSYHRPRAEEQMRWHCWRTCPCSCLVPERRCPEVPNNADVRRKSIGHSLRSHGCVPILTIGPDPSFTLAAPFFPRSVDIWRVRESHSSARMDSPSPVRFGFRTDLSRRGEGLAVYASGFGNQLELKGSR